MVVNGTVPCKVRAYLHFLRKIPIRFMTVISVLLAL